MTTQIMMRALTLSELDDERDLIQQMKDLGIFTATCVYSIVKQDDDDFFINGDGTPFCRLMKITKGKQLMSSEKF